MNTAPACTISTSLDQRFRTALARAPDAQPAALQQAFDAYLQDVSQQLRAFAQRQGGQYVNALSHAIARSPFHVFVRHDFTRTLPTEVLWNIFAQLSPDDLRSMADLNQRSFDVAQALVGAERLLSTRPPLATSAPQRLSFEDDPRGERRWGGYPNPNPVHPGWFLKSHEDAVEVSQIEGDRLVSHRRWPVPYWPRVGAIANAWHPSGDSYAFVGHERDNGLMLYTCSRAGGVLTRTPLSLASVNRIEYVRSQPELMALGTPSSRVIVRASAPQDVLCSLPGWPPISESTRAFCPVRPWVLRRMESRTLVVDCGSTEPRVLHNLDVQWGNEGDAAWHATRPIFAVADDNHNFCVVNLEGDEPVVTKTSIWNIIKFNHSSSYGFVFLAWEPNGKDIVAASCSDELLVVRIRNNEPVRVAVGPIADVNGRRFNWTRDGHLEVLYTNGDVARYKPAERELT